MSSLNLVIEVVRKSSQVLFLGKTYIIEKLK